MVLSLITSKRRKKNSKPSQKIKVALLYNVILISDKLPKKQEVIKALSLDWQSLPSEEKRIYPSHGKASDNKKRKFTDDLLSGVKEFKRNRERIIIMAKNTVSAFQFNANFFSLRL
jgi:hypothetical protein